MEEKKIQKDTIKHNGYADAAQQQRKLANFGGSWTVFSGFLVEHNFPLSSADHAGKLFKNVSRF